MKSQASALALVALLSLSFPTQAPAAQLLDRLEASVNNKLILLSDIATFRRTLKLRAQLDPLFAGTTLAEKGEKSSDAEIIDFLINEKLISEAFPISDSQVETEINNIQAANRIDRAALRNAIRDQGFSFEDYFELIRAGAAKRNLIESDIRTRVTITDDDIKNYFLNHYAAGSSASRAYHVKIITVSTRTFKTPAAARDAIQQARKAIEGGESFEEVARRASDDASASTGGELGTLTEDQMSPAIRNEMKKLRVGQVSGILGNGSSGFFILKLVDVKTTESDRYEKVKEEIRNQLTSAEYQRQIALWIERQRQSAFIHRAGEPAVAGLPR